MSRFEFELVDFEGQFVRGNLESSDPSEAFEELRQRGFLIRLVEIPEFGNPIVLLEGPSSRENFRGCLGVGLLILIPFLIVIGLETLGMGIGGALGLPPWAQWISGILFVHLVAWGYICWHRRKLRQLYPPTSPGESTDDSELENR